MQAFEGIPFVALGEDPIFTYPLPDPVDTVLEIELTPEPTSD